MLLIPAIDIKGGRCVRLRQGDMKQETVFSEDPVAMADRWVAAGARRLHIVDLDGATQGRAVNAGLVRDIARNHPDLPIQVGGGIRDEETIEAYLETGVRFVILGTQAVNVPHFVSDVCAEFASHIIVGLDAKDGKVAIDGWSKLSHHDLADIAQHFENDGVEAIIYTDISRDGMLSGVNAQGAAELAETVRIPIIAAGGVRSLDDVRALCAVTGSGVVGGITGRAIYEGTLDFTAGQALADELSGGD
ncbi:MAG: 1-(5-phosphoribosyl)-5-[(5-phosphoribosylamino)methylideneamino]imidazole-4-carboxamide isomerase [Gammaproteobacteria bacterium]|jgi:phosphoribosylformimino-5-aminoimidazole carboxamide ribotide isomerase|nr:1-(5-phosphoribosyl)-5-[(5-phosphoribosylamino)methylideneamino]imidazole-4-carboxamide isomerase [Gammaproteobacteria bacterium]